MSFSDLGLVPGLVAALAEDGIADPSPIQRQAVPAMLGGASVVAVARTGSGKTLAYSLALLQRLRDVEDAEGTVTERARPRAIVLTSTRELVDQTIKVLKKCAHTVKQRIRAAAGGLADRQQRIQLADASDVLVANPPRLVSLVKSGAVSLDDVRLIVVDEADTLLAPGQRGDIEFLLDRVPPEHQVAFFSATLPEAIRAWVLRRPEHPVLLLSKDAHSAPESVKVKNVTVKAADRTDAIHDVLVAAPPNERGIVFANRRETADEIGRVLIERGHDVVVVHGGLKPDERRAALKAFRAGKGRLLVTTELGGRGLHVDGLGLVVNYELPEKPSEYLHRIGRVGRQGAKGRVVNLVTPSDNRLLAEVERLAKGGKLDTGESLRGPRQRRQNPPRRR